MNADLRSLDLENLQIDKARLMAGWKGREREKDLYPQITLHTHTHTNDTKYLNLSAKLLGLPLSPPIY